jgi:hypothetical protein
MVQPWDMAIPASRGTKQLAASMTNKKSFICFHGLDRLLW